VLFLAAFLGWGWPKEKTQFGPESGAPKWLSVDKIPACCGSMRPVLRGGEKAYFDTYHGQPLNGYIVDTGTVLHRVVAENERAVLTSGDANSRSDGWTLKSKIRWVLVYVVR